MGAQSRPPQSGLRVSIPLRTSSAIDPARPGQVVVRVHLPPELDCEGGVVCIESIRVAGQLLSSPLIPCKSLRTSTPGISCAPWTVQMIMEGRLRACWGEDVVTACVTRDGRVFLPSPGGLRVLSPGEQEGRSHSHFLHPRSRLPCRADGTPRPGLIPLPQTHYPHLPRYVASSPDGGTSLYLVRSASERRRSGHEVVALDPDSGAELWVSPSDVHGCGGIAVGCGCVFVSSYAHSQILVYSASNGRRIPVEMGGRRPLVIGSPSTLAFDPLSRVLFVSHRGARHHALRGMDRTPTEDVLMCRWEGRGVLQQLGVGDIEDLRADIEGTVFSSSYPRTRPMAVLVDPRWTSCGSEAVVPGPSRLVIGVMDSPVLDVLSIDPATGILTRLGLLDLTGWHADARAACFAAVASRPPACCAEVATRQAAEPVGVRQALRQRSTAESVRALAADPTGGALLVLTMRGVIAVPAYALPGGGA